MGIIDDFLKRHGVDPNELPVRFTVDTSATDDDAIRHKNKSDADTVSPSDFKNLNLWDSSMQGRDKAYRALEIGVKEGTLPRYLNNGTFGMQNQVAENKSPYIPSKAPRYTSIINVDSPAQTTEGVEIKVKPKDTYQLALEDPSKIIDTEEEKKIIGENNNKMSDDELKNHLSKYITADKFYERYYNQTDFLEDWKLIAEYNRLKGKSIIPENQELYNNAAARLMQFNEYALKHGMGNIWNIYAGIERGNGVKEALSFSSSEVRNVVFVDGKIRTNQNGDLVLDLGRISNVDSKIIYNELEPLINIGLGATVSFDNNLGFGFGKEAVARLFGIQVPTTGGKDFYTGKT